MLIFRNEPPNPLSDKQRGPFVRLELSAGIDREGDAVKLEEEFFAVEKDGKFWGKVWDDGRDVEFGWGGLTSCKRVEPEYMQEMEKLVDPNCLIIGRQKKIEEILTGSIVKVKLFSEVLAYDPI